MIQEFYGKGLNYLETYQQELPAVMQQIRTEGKENKIPIVDDDMGRFLRLICSLSRPQSILEIGVGISYASHWMLLGNPTAEITGLDFNQGRLDQAAAFLAASGHGDQVTLLRMWGKDFFQQNEARFDLILQDSTKKEYAGMLDSCYESLNKNGLLIVDNIFYNGKVFGLTPDQEKKYRNGVNLLEEFNRNVSVHPGFECHFFAISDGVLVAQRKE